MCGHDTIGVSTALIESGIIEPVEPLTKIILDTPAGLVKVSVKVEDNVARDVTFANVPAFLLAKDKEVNVKELGKIQLDVAYGGNFYIIVNDQDIDEKLVPEKSNEIIRKSLLIKEAVNAQIDVYHPEKPFINEATHVLVTGKPATEGGDTKNVVVIPPGSIDRSPCGTGTSSKLAALFARGLIKEGEELVFESIINTKFKGKVIGTTKVGEFDAIIPEITGRAYIMGLNTWVIDPEDPIQEGFLLGRKTT